MLDLEPIRSRLIKKFDSQKDKDEFNTHADFDIADLIDELEKTRAALWNATDATEAKEEPFSRRQEKGLWTCPNCGCNKYSTIPPDTDHGEFSAKRVCLDCKTSWKWDSITNDFPGFEEGYQDAD